MSTKTWNKATSICARCYARSYATGTVRRYDDPYLLSQTVKMLLDKNDRATAVQLVKDQYTRVQTPAVWNLLIAHEAKQGHTRQVQRLYNDMKKRGVTPNGQTYTMVLSSQQPNDAEEMYEKMDSANVIHTNALLSKFSAADQFDRLWNLYGSMPLGGPNGPDQRTHTIVLSALEKSKDANAFHNTMFVLNKILARTKLVAPSKTIDDTVARVLTRALATATLPKEVDSAISIIARLYGLRDAARADIPTIGLKPFRHDIPALDSILLVCMKLRRPREGLAFYNEMRRRVNPDIHIYHRVLRLHAIDYAEGKEISPSEAAIGIQKEIKERNLETTALSWERLMEACSSSANKWNDPVWLRAKELWFEMENTHKIGKDMQGVTAPTPRTCTALLRCAARADERTALERAVTLIESLGSGISIATEAIKGKTGNKQSRHAAKEFLLELAETHRRLKEWRKSRQPTQEVDDKIMDLQNAADKL